MCLRVRQSQGVQLALGSLRQEHGEFMASLVYGYPETLSPKVNNSVINN